MNDDNEKPDNTGEKLARDENGRFIEGSRANPNGRPKGSKNYLTQLEKSLEKQALKEDKSFFDKIAEWCFRYPNVATAILKKFIPDMQHIEHEGLESVEITHKYDKG